MSDRSGLWIFLYLQLHWSGAELWFSSFINHQIGAEFGFLETVDLSSGADSDKIGFSNKIWQVLLSGPTLYRTTMDEFFSTSLAPSRRVDTFYWISQKQDFFYSLFFWFVFEFLMSVPLLFEDFWGVCCRGICNKRLKVDPPLGSYTPSGYRRPLGPVVRYLYCSP